MRVVATSAVREAINGRAFAERLEHTTGIAVTIVSGEQEARLTIRGVLAGNNRKNLTRPNAAQTAAPTIVAISPADQAGSVPVNANIHVLFSGPIDPLTVNGTSIQVSGGGQTAVPGSISFSNGNQTVLITPQAPLPASVLGPT